MSTLIISIPHSGNHTVSRRLNDVSWIHTTSDFEDSLNNHYFANPGKADFIFLMRDPKEIYASWVKRGLPVGKTFRECWLRFQKFTEENAGQWVYIDRPEYESQLIEVANKLNIVLQPVGPNLNVFPDSVTVVTPNKEQNMLLDQYQVFLQENNLGKEYDN